MPFKETVKKHKADIILAGVISILCVIGIVVYSCIKTKSNANYAKIYVKNSLVEEINLRDASETNTDISVLGTNGYMKITYHKGEIKVSESNCPHQYCVNKGYINTANNPIICVHNAVYIVIEGTSSYDVAI